MEKQKHGNGGRRKKLKKDRIGHVKTDRNRHLLFGFRVLWPESAFRYLK